MSARDIELRVAAGMFLFVARSDDGRAFLEKRAGDSVRVGEAFMVEAREGRVVISLMLEAGLRVTRLSEEE